MKNVLASINLTLTDALNATANNGKTWQLFTRILETSDKTTKKKTWWVRCDIENSLLAPKDIAALQDAKALGNSGLPKKKRAGSLTCLCWEVNVSALQTALKSAATEASKLIIMQSRVKELEQQLRAAQEESAASQSMARLVESLDTHFKTKGVSKPIKFKRAPQSKTKALGGVPTLFLSDWHWGEKVNSSQIEGLNEYNLDIARKRADRVFSTSLDLLFHHQSGLYYDGMVVPLGGDMFSGIIHDELRATNEMGILECLIDLAEVLTNGILRIADEFPGVFIPAVVGNHGRTTQKPSAKNAVAENYDWLLYVLVQKFVKGRLGDRCNVDFKVSSSLDTSYSIYGTRYLLTHGDQIKESTNAGAFWPSLIDVANKKQQRSVKGQSNGFDYMLCAHFHRYGSVSNVIVNGSLKGYDEWVYSKNIDYEEPVQAMWLTHPDNGIISHTPIYAQDPIRDERRNLPPISQDIVKPSFR